MRRALLFLSVLAASGCFNPDDIFPVRGSVLSPDGVEGVTVELLRAPTATSATELTCDDAKPFKTATTDAEGKFLFELFRAQTQSLSGQGINCFRVRVAFPSGATARSDLSGVFSEVVLEPMRDWRAAPRLEDGVVRFTPAVDDLAAAEDAGQQVGHRAEFLLGDGGTIYRAEDMQSFFSSTPLRGDLRFPPAALEDFPGVLRMVAVVQPAPRNDQGPFGGGFGSPVWLEAAERVPLTGAATPLTRGLSCASIRTPCPLTDGELEPVDLGARQSFTLDFGADVDAGFVVLRALQTVDPTFSLRFFAADGGLVQQRATLAGVVDQADFVAPFGLLDSFESSPRRRRDGGVRFGEVPARWVAVPVEPLQPVRRMTVSFPSAGVQELGEASVFAR